MENNVNANNGAQQAAVQLEVGATVRPSDTASHDLDPGFRLTRGKIVSASVLSGLHAHSVTECDNVLLVLGVSSKLTDKERDVVLPLLVRGFRDAAALAGTSVTGGQTASNPWLIIGGCATSCCHLA
ncbi:hypothetical protein HPB51_013050 [Rhipicephalus microplus]|uniref:Uncharacterized protein n=1 Tax=Rhipicephalus microplus TaxID=6941 RepID=A0A9J6F463_RHIMP|nr:hypothetical protein HPB51_013050 [Rhipicephalus microplus]